MNYQSGPHVEKVENVKRDGSFAAILSACLALAIVLLGIAFAVKVSGMKTEAADNQKLLVEAKADAAKAQAAVDKDKANTAELQAQLDKAKSELQSQTDVSKLAATEQKAEQDKAKGASAELVAQVEADKTHAAELQTQVEQATAGSTQLQAQLAQAKIQTVDLQARLQKAESDIAELQPLLAKAKHMPVTTSVDKAQGGRSFTLHINNLNADPVSVDVAITGANKPRSQHVIIGSGATQNVEKLSAGENIVITSGSYDPVKLTVI